jgi:hypothetical protein
VAEVREAKPFTSKQGQYLAFIYYYTKIHDDRLPKPIFNASSA